MARSSVLRIPNGANAIERLHHLHFDRPAKDAVQTEQIGRIKPLNPRRRLKIGRQSAYRISDVVHQIGPIGVIGKHVPLRHPGRDVVLHLHREIKRELVAVGLLA